MTATCPVCDAPQDAGLLCHTCTTRLERDLGDVAAIVADLDVSMSKQARIGAGGSGGLARERSPMNVGAMEAGDNLANVLTTWARDVRPYTVLGNEAMKPAYVASRILLANVDLVRRHPAVNELVDEIHDAVAQARRVVDRPADRIYLGQCYVETEGPDGMVTCYAELWASPGASEVRCKVCGMTHPVTERRVWLMEKAADMLVSAKDASSYLGEVGGINVTQASIRGYVHRGKLAYRAPVDAKRFRLGDLLTVLVDESERKGAA